MLFFFFKQKTAYEMRISDWSSDVCSSDLIAEQADVSLSTISKVLNGRADVSAATRGRVEDLLSRHGYRRRGTPTSSSLVELVFHELEIGRASCRERVCQSV